MVYVDPRVAEKVAKMTGVHEAVKVKRDEIAAVARGLFASHDRPGGHEITTTDGRRTDAFVNLVGPAPLAVELGHWTPDHKRHVDGLHVLGRAIGQASA